MECPHPTPDATILITPDTRGERIADRVTSVMGSWRFIIWQTAVVAVWITVNTLTLTNRWHIDVFPYILLNLAFSTQAAYASPLILMASNRQSQRDHARDNQEAREVDILYQMNDEQLRLLQEIRQIIGPATPTPDSTKDTPQRA